VNRTRRIIGSMFDCGFFHDPFVLSWLLKLSLKARLYFLYYLYFSEFLYWIKDEWYEEIMNL
jgi:hypothetical protein